MARYIDADKVLQSIGAAEHCKDCSFNIGLYDCRGHSLSRQDVCDIIEDLCQDTADVKPVVMGKWIEDGYNDEPCVCSNCGHPEPIKAMFLYSYCPNCGARMGNKDE